MSSFQVRNSTNKVKLTGNGPFLAEIVSHLDSTRNGALQVTVLSGAAGDPGKSDSFSTIVDYLPPFFGHTPYSAMDSNNRDSNSSQTSYGMWFVPPDIGTQVLVIFIDGDSNRGYWIGCVPQTNMNYMVPGLAASRYAELTPQEKQKIGLDEEIGVPVTEYNRRMTDKTGTTETNKIKRPMHPFALRLAEQGLLKDPIRGVATSSARREMISNVYGISTPGPYVLGKTYNMGDSKSPTKTYTTREGGTQFVMDDGYISNDQKTGKRGIIDELVRIRTRTGHQILMHNSSDLIYIANAKGTAWLEMTSDGKIDIFAADSVSIHSENDFNFRADRDVNIEAGRNVNMRSVNGTHIEAGGWIEAISALEINLTSNKHMNLNANGKLRLTSDVNVTSPLQTGIEMFVTTGNIDMYSLREIKMQTVKGLTVRAAADIVMLAGKSTTITTGAEFSIDTVGNNFITSKAANVLTSAAHYERSVLIDMNGPTVAPASTSAATNLALALDALAVLPQYSTTVTFLDKYTLPYREADKGATIKQQKGWEQNNYYRQPDISSIMRRVPTHEPWDHHESIDPTQFKTDKTDRGG